MTTSIIPGAERPEAPPEEIRRAWLRRRVSASTEAVDALIALALGDLPEDLQHWPTPAWAGPASQGMGAHL